MPTLFQALLSQHTRTLKPMRYTEAMTLQLQSFFEEVVLENSLRALVVENLPLRRTRAMREIERVRRIGNTARYSFFFISPNDELTHRFKYKNQPEAETENKLTILSRFDENETNERFVVIADTHFSALLCAVRDPATSGLQVIYTFDPDVTYTALEYLGARFTVEHPTLAGVFMEAVDRSMPKATSIHLTLAVTNKLASLWQEQLGREAAINKIATEIRQSLELDQVLQNAVNEVANALNVKCCALLVEPEGEETASVVYYREELSDEHHQTISSDLEVYKKRFKNHPKNYVRDGSTGVQAEKWQDLPQIVVPLLFLGQFVGVLMVQSEKPTRVWQESEILLLQTVADQVAVAIRHARLFTKLQHEALRDSLTGVFNRNFFELQFEREFRLAERKNSTFAVIMIDVDNFKQINDSFGHSVGDRALRCVAQLLRSSLRTFDTLARIGGEEFVVLLQGVDEAEALITAEKLRKNIQALEIPDIEHLTASFGVAVYPNTAQSMPDLLKSADKALYRAKRQGRNLVCLATPACFEPTEKSPEKDANEISEEEAAEKPRSVVTI